MHYPAFAIILIISLCFNAPLYAQWEAIGSGINLGQRVIFSLSAVDEQIIWAVPIKTDFTANHEYTRTTDGGLTWQQGSLPNVTEAYYPGNIFALSERKAWVIMINLPQQNQIKIFRTDDGGASWKEQTGGFNKAGHAFATLHFFNEHEGVGFGSPGTGLPAVDSIRIYRTNDGGENWNRIPAEALPEPLENEGVWIYSGNNSYDVRGDTIWFVTRAGRVIRSADKGISWEAFDVGISGSPDYSGLASIAFADALNGMAVAYQPGRAARTTDGGKTWSEIYIPSSTTLGAIEFVPETPGTYIVHGGLLSSSSKMLLTKDGGTSWETVDYAPPMVCLQFISPTLGFGGRVVNPAGNVGMYRWVGDLSASTTTSVQDRSSDARLLTVYPNPTSEKLIISFEEKVFEDSVLLVEILSADGRVLQRNEQQNTSRIETPIHSLPKGAYYVRIGNKTKQLTKKFMIEQ